MEINATTGAIPGSVTSDNVCLNWNEKHMYPMVKQATMWMRDFKAKYLAISASIIGTFAANMFLVL